jgi:U3 small nucleolar RNA-associated protein 19
MPGLLNGDYVSKKRKLGKSNKETNSKRRVVVAPTEDASTAQIERLESGIAESRRNYNNITASISMINVAKPAESVSLAATVSLCRVFARLLTAGSLSESTNSAEQEKVITAWLKQRYQEYQDLLLTILQNAAPAVQAGIRPSQSFTTY